jgi:hypothetical protein
MAAPFQILAERSLINAEWNYGIKRLTHPKKSPAKLAGQKGAYKST